MATSPGLGLLLQRGSSRDLERGTHCALQLCLPSSPYRMWGKSVPVSFHHFMFPALFICTLHSNFMRTAQTVCESGECVSERSAFVQQLKSVTSYPHLNRRPVPCLGSLALVGSRKPISRFAIHKSSAPSPSPHSSSKDCNTRLSHMLWLMVGWTVGLLNELEMLIKRPLHRCDPACASFRS